MKRGQWIFIGHKNAFFHVHLLPFALLFEINGCMSLSHYFDIYSQKMPPNASEPSSLDVIFPPQHEHCFVIVILEMMEPIDSLIISFQPVSQPDCGGPASKRAEPGTGPRPHL